MYIYIYIYICHGFATITKWILSLRTGRAAGVVHEVTRVRNACIAAPVACRWCCIYVVPVAQGAIYLSIYLSLSLYIYIYIYIYTYV